MSTHDRSHSPVPSVVRIVAAALSTGLAASGVILAFAATGPLWAKILSGTILLLVTVAGVAYAVGFNAGMRSASRPNTRAEA